MRAATIAICVMLLCIATAKSSTVRVELTPAEAAAIGTNTPFPEYPLEARRRRTTGSGMFAMEVEYQTGIVRRLHIERSTGSALLDQAAMVALRKWRFKPQALRVLQRKYDPTDKSPEMGVHVPITFTLSKT
jgi:TonB family protein